MKNTAHFTIERSRTSVRWQNWRSFCEAPVERAQQADFVCVVVTYNASARVIALMERLLGRGDACDALIVDNCSAVEHRRALVEFCAQRHDLTLLCMATNLGGAGGYSAAVEWALARTYKAVFVTEDDVVPIGGHTIKDIIGLADPNVLLDWYYHNNGTNAFSLHGRLYPRALLECSGGPDPALFMRCDDQEWAYRTRAAERSLHIQHRNLPNLRYLHPIVKKQRDSWGRYFEVRNRLRTEAVHGSIHGWLRDICQYLPSGYSLALTGHGTGLLWATMLGIMDYTFRRNSPHLNASRFERLRKIRLSLPVGAKEERISRGEFHFPQNAAIVGDSLARALGRQPTPTLGGVFRSPVLVTNSYFGLRHPFWLFRSSITFIEEVDIESGDVLILHWTNRFRFPRLRGTIAMILSVPTALCVVCLAAPRLVSERLRYHAR